MKSRFYVTHSGAPRPDRDQLRLLAEEAREWSKKRLGFHTVGLLEDLSSGVLALLAECERLEQKRDEPVMSVERARAATGWYDLRHRAEAAEARVRDLEAALERLLAAMDNRVPVAELLGEVVNARAALAAVGGWQARAGTALAASGPAEEEKPRTYQGVPLTTREDAERNTWRPSEGEGERR